MYTGQKNGFGIYHYINGNKYEGSWVNDKKVSIRGPGRPRRCGKGWLGLFPQECRNRQCTKDRFYSNSIYFWVAFWLTTLNKYLQNGHGTYYYNSTGEKYTGNWKDGKKNDMGTMYYTFGEKYVGQFLNGEKVKHGSP